MVKDNVPDVDLDLYHSRLARDKARAATQEFSCLLCVSALAIPISANCAQKSFCMSNNYQVTKGLQTFLDGQAQNVRIYENISYHDLDANNAELLWSLLYHTGYVTKAKKREPFEIDSETNKACLVLPNKTIQQIVLDAFFQEISLSIPKISANRAIGEEALLPLLWTGQAELLAKTISEILDKTITFFDYHKRFYLAFLRGIISAEAGSKLTLYSNRENGPGLADISLFDHDHTQITFLQINVAQSQEELNQKADEALRQIEKKLYTRTLSKDFTKTVKWGIAFWQKHCLAKESL